MIACGIVALAGVIAIAPVALDGYHAAVRRQLLDEFETLRSPSNSLRSPNGSWHSTIAASCGRSNPG
jgi:hypothetical protein